MWWIVLPARFAPCPPTELCCVSLRQSGLRRLLLYLRKTHRQHDLASEEVFNEKPFRVSRATWNFAKSIRSHRHGASTAVR
jgi:hypothetical protein